MTPYVYNISFDGRSKFPIRKIGNSKRKDLRNLNTSVTQGFFPPVVKKGLILFLTYIWKETAVSVITPECWRRPQPSGAAEQGGAGQRSLGTHPGVLGTHPGLLGAACQEQSTAIQNLITQSLFLESFSVSSFPSGISLCENFLPQEHRKEGRKDTLTPVPT